MAVVDRDRVWQRPSRPCDSTSHTRTCLHLYDVPFWGLDVLVEAVVVAPVAVNEMVLAGWLIVKGFDSSANSSGSRYERTS